MPCEKNKQPTCVYPCKEHCAETAFYVDNPQAVAAAQNTKLYGYDLIYVAHPETKKVFMFGNVEGFYLGNGKEEKDAFSVHEKAFNQALKGNVVNYAWSLDRGPSTYYYHSTLVPLFDEHKKVANLLGLVRNLQGEMPAGQMQALHDGGGHTFSQILLAAREEEKREISKALHDEIGFSFSERQRALQQQKTGIGRYCPVGPANQKHH